MSRLAVRSLFLSAAVLPLLWNLCPEVAAGKETAEYSYEQKDPEHERTQYLVRIKTDLEKCDLAIENTRVLIARSVNRPYQPTLLLRLAELYIEKSRLAYFLRRGSHDGEESELDHFEANMLKQEAIEIYQQILSHHPDFEGCDKVRFFLAHEYRELGDLDGMLAQYKMLISRYPDSGYVPEARLLIGDYQFNQKQNLDAAIAEYTKVLDYPDSPASAIARYKLAWCRINEEDFAGALVLFEAAISGDAGRPVDIDTYRRVDVRLESIVDMAYCYPEVYKKADFEEALAYFQRHAWSRPVYALVLEKLASRFYVKKKWRNAAGVYRVLSDLRQDPEKLLDYTHRIFECVQALGTYDTAEKDVALVVKALEKQKYSVHVDPEEKETNLKNFELYAREAVTHLHARARQTDSAADFEMAADAYSRYLDFFDDVPAAEDMRANYAEALFSARRYLEAGRQYEKLTPEITINRKSRRESLYSAVIAYYNALKEKDSLNFYERAFARAGLRSAGQLFVDENPDASRTPDVAFNVAWVAYDVGDYADAINEFAGFVDAYPQHQAATAAVHLTLDAYHLLGDREGLIRYGKAMLTDNRHLSADLRNEIGQIVQGAEMKMVSAMTMTAMNDWESGKAALSEMSSDENTAMGEQALNALVITAREKQDLATLFDAGQRFVDRFAGSDQAEATLGLLVDTALKIGQLRLLGPLMEQYAGRYPKSENALDFMYQAGQIHQALGRYAAANNAYRKRLAMGPVSEALLSEMVFTMADNAEQLGNPGESAALLGKYLTRLNGADKARAYARMSTHYLATGQRSLSRKYSKMAKQAFGRKPYYEDVTLREAMGEMVYGELRGRSGPFYALQFKGDIDNKVFARKNELLKTLEDGYQEVIGFKSPGWALKSCFRAGELNREFARFLLNSPVPQSLSPQQRQEYQAILAQKAATYREKADAYIQNAAAIATKAEICEPALAGYFLPAGAPSGSETAVSPFSPGGASREMGRQCFEDQACMDLYQALLASPDAVDPRMTLAETYLSRGDYTQAMLIAQNLLSDVGGGDDKRRAALFNLIGVCRLHRGQDQLARSAFREALSLDKRNRSARVNLAGLYNHYGHTEKAAGLGIAPGEAAVGLSNQRAIDPRAGELLNANALVR